MSNRIIEIAGSSDTPILRAQRDAPVRGGGSRVVPSVPVGSDGSCLPCIWKSSHIIQAELGDGSRVPANEALLLVSKTPPVVVRAEIPVDSWQHFGECLVEW